MVTVWTVLPAPDAWKVKCSTLRPVTEVPSSKRAA
jgi:hypothetical protein